MRIPCVGEPLGRRERALAADRDDGIDAQALHVGLDDVGAAAVFERVGAGGTQDGAALLGNAADHGPGDVDDVALNNAAPAVEETDELVAVDGNSFKDCTADNRIQSGAVATAGKDSNFHVSLKSWGEGLQAERHAELT